SSLQEEAGFNWTVATWQAGPAKAIADLPLASPGARRADMASNNYAHPEALVETDWLAQHLKNDGIRIVESNEDILLYDTGHIPCAVHIDWLSDLQDPVIRHLFPPDNL